MTNGGELDLPSRKKITEISASPKELTIRVRPGVADGEYDNITFAVNNGSTETNLGAVACLSESKLFPNGVASVAQRSVEQTNALDR
jgi:hypothetical protein